MTRYNISTPKTYTAKDGTEKTQWINVGTLIKFEATQDKPEGFILEWNISPNQKFGVFPQEEKKAPETKPVEKKLNTKTSVDPSTGESIDPEDIPF